MCKIIIASSTILLCLLLSSCAQIEQKHALLIGNTNYKSSQLNLINPVNDVNDLSTRLGDLGFKVTALHDLGRKTSLQSIEDFYQEVDRAGKNAISIFYYAGHAVQIDDKNVLIPPSSDITSKQKLFDTGINLDDVFNFMRITENEKNIVILDACRTNPFRDIESVEYENGRMITVDGSVKTLESGLEGVNDVDAPGGTLIAYASDKGAIAYDGDRSNGTYTYFLLQHMVKHKRIEDVFKLVRDDVRKETINKVSPQTPWYYTSLGDEEIYFYSPLSKETAILPDIF